ncbi:TPA: hypothetical protein I0H06_RS12985 [Enterococcus faecalis]|uniref:DUF7006 family protein n=1 Tax=Enterococcus faecalis TaxID=1351 RepID=UPI001158320B|nr:MULTISPECIES: hypothetical protein [Bacilli]EGO6085909.1 hypothetical protein [Enterococcus faecalis]EIT2197014.1 hypothetical protein [Enterococcus faecalis]ELY8689108.1 hypothetical protein [Enterococcus faecalis]MDN4125471.1 hypothetical protein [Staphylococcus aureus]NSN09626.1 hypothetical protein [Enterococcus faecalis]
MGEHFESKLFYRNQYFERFMYLEMIIIEKNKVKVLEYIRSLKTQLEELITKISEQNFWNTLPKILGIDAKLSLIEEFSEEQISESELISLVEKDFVKINQENFGYKLNEEPPKSIIFFVE